MEICEILANEDHPRIRGTNWSNEQLESYFAGSSPHTRDKSIYFVFCHFQFGIIPAYAGQIMSRSGFSINTRDHPRIRGTNRSVMVENVRCLGSSPHTRDKFSFYRDVFLYNGIIPAYAGQILLLLVLGISLRDHPRIRGTNLRIEAVSTLSGGSSPHTRDKSKKPCKPTTQVGIIPAYAGQMYS